MLLVRSGSYCSVLTYWPPSRYKRKQEPDYWAKRASKLGEVWRRTWVSRRTVPPRVSSLWARIIGLGNTPLHKVSGNQALCQDILELCAIADEACQGVGSPLDGQESKADEKFLYYGAGLLHRELPGSSACVEIHPSRLRVLPKMHTPQNGLTIRSLSLYVCLCAPNEVVPAWIEALSPLTENSLNLLVIPWPMEVFPAQFREAQPLPAEMSNMPGRFGFFTLVHRASSTSVVEFVKPLYESALEEVGRIDGVVLPELALSESDHHELRNYVLGKGSFLVSGVGKTSDAPRSRGENRACLDLPFTKPFSQQKHHRWKLDSQQIGQYGLGSLLDPERDWWEHIGLEERRFSFASIHNDMVLSVLICEDLARPDPVGDLLRAVGPNLAIALLMDGPQTNGRWAARYATTLADDPGTSVLSVTSLGMAKLSRPRRGKSKPRTIALWKDAKSGESQEITIDDGAGGVVLSLSMRHIEEWTADGRSDEGSAVYPVLSGVHCVRQPQN
jgi:hypothetical protein